MRDVRPDREFRFCLGPDCVRARRIWDRAQRPQRPRPTETQRFWANVNTAGPIPAHCPELGACWLWAGAAQSQGYGTLSVRDRDTLAHRFSWTLHRGPVPEGLDVLHECDTPRCVNPAHLFLGTHAQNMADMARKGRSGQLGATWMRGEGNGHAKLTEAAVLDIRRRHAPGMLPVLAAEYGVTKQAIWLVVKGKVWMHVA